jgi:hypothetical protein
MKKLAFLIAILATLAAALPASGAVLLAKNCTKSCSAFQANGNGWVSVVGNGAEWGSLNSGTIWMRDRTGNSNPKNWLKQHTGQVHWTYLGDDGWKGTSTKSMTISVCAKSFWVKVQGQGIHVGGMFDGSGELAGTGNYQIGLTSPWRDWRSHATDLHF